MTGAVRHLHLLTVVDSADQSHQPINSKDGITKATFAASTIDCEFRMPVIDGANFDYDEYFIERIRGERAEFMVARHTSLRLDDMMARLICGYKPGA